MVGELSDNERCMLETAMSDRALCARLKQSQWMYGAEYQMPSWLDEDSSAIIGMPCLTPQDRIAEFDELGAVPETCNERRLVRNKLAIKQLLNTEKASKADAAVTARDALQATNLRSTVLAPFYRRIEDDHNTIVQLRQELFDVHAALQRKEHEIDAVQAVDTPKEEQPLVIHDAASPALITNGAEELVPNTNVSHDHPSIADIEANQPVTTVRLDARAVVPHVQKQALISQATPPSHSRTPKRKATAPPSRHGQEFFHLTEGRIFDQALADLATSVVEQLRQPLQKDPIDACGTAPLGILLLRPRDALALAHKQLHATTPAGVNPCWRRLYEDATLHLVAQLLRKQAMKAQPSLNRAKRVKLTDGADSGAWLQEIVGKLDQAIIVAGAPGRRGLIDSIFQQLDSIAQRTLSHEEPQPLVKGPTPRSLNTQHPITRPKCVMTQQAFGKYVDRAGNAVRPLVLQGVMAEWPAIELWQDLLYLKRHTMAGHRLVPVEVGKSYTDPGWGQEIITFSEFAERFLIPDQPQETGYLAQYDIFHQIPTLRSDIHVPDYCYSATPPLTGAAARTKGVDTVQELDEPLLNAWLGPKGTKSPLHTDPYHNILCQVVGYKYVRLYAPEQTDRLYPMGTDEAGIEMGNTSEVDISVIRPTGYVSPELDALRADTRKRFPLLEKAEYEEAVLGPGESLYIPLGWWHYVESLTTSISVSFWWN